MSQVENPYQTPQATLQGELEAPLLASRGARLGAALIDGLIMCLLSVPLFYKLGFYDGLTTGQEPAFGLQVLGALIGLAAFLLVNGLLLKRYGQTVGKRLLKLAIVDLDGNTPAFLPMYLKRYLLWGAIVYVPVIGWLLVLIDCLFIFRGDRRCLHDLTASTRVVSRLG
ncbi:RDD family protein [Pseudomonas cavernae]|uniref:RDD family protein n=1 Tax=Pseudomonas cavernae TaxID=2320867 RepID=A0A385Z3J3_9PSED|nr:RDD family protein [Pseudomonas cavernae]AYC33231.1 RDD family protein [Pseudomonas cavernae]